MISSEDGLKRVSMSIEEFLFLCRVVTAQRLKIARYRNNLELSDSRLEVLGISERIDSEPKDRFTSETIRFALIVLAFITPYALWIGLGPPQGVRLIAPLWSFSSMGYPVFVIWSLDNLITELPFGLIRLAFVRQVLRYKKRLTTPTSLILVGVLCELPGPFLPYVGLLSGWGFFPFPLFLLVGLLLARYCSKEPISWIEVEET